MGRVPEWEIFPSSLSSPARKEEGIRHQELSYLLVKEWFTQKKFDVLTSGEKEEILYAIRYHGDDKAEAYSLANILRDADKLDLLGEIGVQRAIEFHKGSKLIKKNIRENLVRAERIKTSTARKIVERENLLEPLRQYLASH